MAQDRRLKYTDTKWFTYENVNPKNRITSDCIVRAICRATDTEYEVVIERICDISTKYSIGLCDKKMVEKYMLNYPHVHKYKQIRKPDNTKITGKEFCDRFPVGRYVISIGGHHFSCVIDGKIHDIWDCSDKTVGNYWEV